jgi:hypothetical protein
VLWPHSIRVTRIEEMEAENPLLNNTVLDENGDTVSLQELWKQGPIVLVFVRHFG